MDEKVKRWDIIHHGENYGEFVGTKDEIENEIHYLNENEDDVEITDYQILSWLFDPDTKKDLQMTPGNKKRV